MAEMQDLPVETNLRLTREGAIAGTIATRGSDPTPFHGWLELMDVLERLRSSDVGER